MTEKMASLLVQWADALVSLQVTDIGRIGLHGGILCPACGRIHGRSGDAVLPLLYAAKHTGNSRYLDSAVALQAWADNVRSWDGSWNNEAASYIWKNTTVFAVIGLSLALQFFRELLPTDIAEEWTRQLRAATEFVYRNIGIETGTINYPISAAAALVTANWHFGDNRYDRRASDLVTEIGPYFTEPNRLLFGEGHPRDCYYVGSSESVDVAYNVEESLPNLALYARYSGDTDALKLVVRSLEHHLPFLLPDGGWDDSWGSRSFKWTYYGSRTTDGSIPLFRLLINLSPGYQEALMSVLNLLESTTIDGILQGGPHYQFAQQRPCIHHTFCHAKGLALALVTEPFETSLVRSCCSDQLNPPDLDRAVVHYPEVKTWIVRKGKWRATVTAYDRLYVKESHPSGGALSLLWHEETGPIIAASTNRFSLIKEADNLQINWNEQNECLTPRLQTLKEGDVYTNLNDVSCTIDHNSDGEAETFRTSGHLRSGELEQPTSQDMPYSITYSVHRDYVHISIAGHLAYRDQSVEFVLPIVTPVELQQEKTDIGITEIPVSHAEDSQEQLVVVIQSSTEPSNSRMVFNGVPGFRARELRFPVSSDFLDLEITVKRTRLYVG